MKKYILILITLQISLFAEGQTLKETQDWLEQKIETFGSTSNSSNISGATSITSTTIEDFDFINNQIIIVETEKTIITSGSIICDITKKNNSKITFNKIRSINIKENQIEIITNGNNIFYQTIFSNKKCSSEEANQMLSTFQNNSVKKSSHYINIDFSAEDNLKERFEKAINHLLTFLPKQKETF